MHKLLACSQCNVLSSISCLPTEVLADVFLHGARGHYYGVRPHPLTHPRPTRLCQRFVPTLWSYVYDTSQQWTKVFLARSKQVSLKIRTRVYHPVEKYSKFFKNHAERIQELRLLCTPEFDGSCKPIQLTPRLQVLEVEGRGHCTSGSVISDAGMLRKMKLTHHCMPCNPCQVRGLTSQRGAYSTPSKYGGASVLFKWYARSRASTSSGCPFL